MNIFRAFASGARGAVLGPSWEGCGAGSVLGRVQYWRSGFEMSARLEGDRR